MILIKNRRIENGDIAPREYDFSKIKIGLKSLDDAVLALGNYRKITNYVSKEEILQALGGNNISKLRDISSFFFEVSGIYNRLCKYLAFLYRYDWYVTINAGINIDAVNKDKMTTDFFKILNFLDNSNLKKMFGDIALGVIKNGCYYGYRIINNNKIVLQELPASYCRSRFYSGTNPVIEFNLKYFDDKFPNVEYRKKILKIFPQ